MIGIPRRRHMRGTILFLTVAVGLARAGEGRGVPSDAFTHVNVIPMDGPKLDPTLKPCGHPTQRFSALEVRSASPSCLMHFVMHFGGSPKLTWLV